MSRKCQSMSGLRTSFQIYICSVAVTSFTWIYSYCFKLENKYMYFVYFIVSKLVHTTHVWNNLHQGRTKPIYLKAKSYSFSCSVLYFF